MTSPLCGLGAFLFGLLQLGLAPGADATAAVDDLGDAFRTRMIAQSSKLIRVHSPVGGLLLTALTYTGRFKLCLPVWVNAERTRGPHFKYRGIPMEGLRARVSVRVFHRGSLIMMIARLLLPWLI